MQKMLSPAQMAAMSKAGEKVPGQGAGGPAGGGPGQQGQQTTYGLASLDNAPINLLAWREHASQELLKILQSVVEGPKGLVLDPRLTGPLGLIAKVDVLKAQGVEKIYHLSDRLDTECRSLIYLIRPKLHFMKHIAEHIHAHQRAGQRKSYFVYFVPRRTLIVERHLEEEGVHEDVTIGEFQLDLIPFDNDVLSLELEESFKECFLEGDRTSLFYTARAIMKLQAMFGIIPHIKAKGHCAKSVVEMMLRMRREMGAEEPKQVTPEINTLILIDRTADLVTPMCTQLTYEGLIDEVFTINNGLVELDPEFLGKTDEKDPPRGGAKPAPVPTGPPKKAKVPLNSNDKLYSELRDMNFSTIGPLLNRKAKVIDEYYKKRYDLGTVAEIRDFMRNLSSYQQEHQSLRLHTNMAEHILAMTKKLGFRKRLETEQNLLAGNESGNEYIEECIDRGEPIIKVLRLLILQSQINGGIKQKDFEFFRSEILSTYGYEYMFTLLNLEKLGMIKKQESGKPAFGILRKPFRLIVEDINEVEPNDIAYVYSGYAPLSVRIVELSKNWRPHAEALALLPGPTIEHDQELPPGIVEEGGTGTKNKVTLVFFLGGVTFTEIAAIRWLGQQDEHTDYIIATTKLISGDSLVSSLIESVSSFIPL